MRITYQEKYDLTKPCVAKLWFGEKYLIVKWLDMKEGIELFKQRLKEQTSWSEINDIALQRIRRRVGAEGLKHCQVQIFLSSNKGEELLAKEQALLNLAARDKNCLNINREPRRPLWLYSFMSERPGPIGGFFRLKGRHRAGPAVVKLWVGKKFFIWKCKDIHVFPDKFNQSMEANIRKYDPSRIDLVKPLVEYIVESQEKHGTIEVIYKAPEEHTGRLLYLEGLLLKKFRGKSICLNRNKKPYKPAWTKELRTS